MDLTTNVYENLENIKDEMECINIKLREQERQNYTTDLLKKYKKINDITKKYDTYDYLKSYSIHNIEQKFIIILQILNNYQKKIQVLETIIKNKSYNA